MSESKVLTVFGFGKVTELDLLRMMQQQQKLITKHAFHSNYFLLTQLICNWDRIEWSDNDNAYSTLPAFRVNPYTLLIQNATDKY